MRQISHKDEQAVADAGRLTNGSGFGISQPAVSQHLRVLRENGWTRVRPEGTRRLYAIEPEPLQEADVWISRFRHIWESRLAALDTEIARGKRERRTSTRTDAENEPEETP